MAEPMTTNEAIKIPEWIKTAHRKNLFFEYVRVGSIYTLSIFGKCVLSVVGQKFKLFPDLKVTVTEEKK